MNRYQRALRLAQKRIRKLLGRPDDPEVVRLRASAPTVSKLDTAKLGKRWIEDQEDTFMKPDSERFEPRDDCSCTFCRRARLREREDHLPIG